MLTAMGIRGKIKPHIKEMHEAVMSAFSGGRFVNSVIGSVNESLEGWDISSAYPYQIAFLPCLQHGFWKHTTRREDLAETRHACVRYEFAGMPSLDGICRSWGPFPFRERNGAISYPIY